MLRKIVNRIYSESDLVSRLYEKSRVLQALYRVYASLSRKLTFFYNRYFGKLISKEQLKRDFKKIGLKEGDIVLVHSSLGNIGFVDGGANTVIDALIETVGDTGTVVVPTMSFLPWDFLDGNVPRFDSKNTPCYTGKIPETFRFREDAIRSLHPTHSLSAIGHKVKYLTENHEKSITPFGKGTPFDKLIECDAYILLIGVDQTINTCVHIIKDRTDSFPYNVYLDGIFEAVIIDNEGNEKVMQTKVHNPDVQRFRDVNKMEKYFVGYNIMRIGEIGNADARLIKVRDQIRVMDILLKKNITIYTVPQHYKDSGGTKA